MSERLRATIALAFSVGAFLALKHLVPFGGAILYPFQMLVTILHEFGHAAGALITGGDVLRIQINSDGSGVTYSAGGWRIPIIAGGYIGSALFGNLLLRAGLCYGSWSRYVLYGLLVVMLAIATVWSGSLANTVFVGIFALSVFVVSKLHEEWAAWFLVFAGTLSVLHILGDFRVGPSSDLSQFAQAVPILPKTAWMFVWLGVVSWITWLNVKGILSKQQ